MNMRLLLKSMLLVAALAAPPVLCVSGFAVVVEVGSSSTSKKLDPDRCSWYCHDHDCPHKARLPAGLTSDDGAFGKTIEALAVSGQATGIGYQGMNVLVFCVLWPIVTYFFYSVAAARAIWNLL
jgi:hypothetical protein